MSTTAEAPGCSALLQHPSGPCPLGPLPPSLMPRPHLLPGRPRRGAVLAQLALAAEADGVADVAALDLGGWGFGGGWGVRLQRGGSERTRQVGGGQTRGWGAQCFAWAGRLRTRPRPAAPPRGCRWSARCRAPPPGSRSGGPGRGGARGGGGVSMGLTGGRGARDRGCCCSRRRRPADLGFRCSLFPKRVYHALTPQSAA
jgi:hypothetical protein